MAVSIANLTSGNDETDDADSVTASITPSANKLILLAFASRADAVQPTVSSVTGCSLTWVEIAHIDYDTSGSRRSLFLYRAMGSSPSSGAITITWGGTQTAKTWVVDEVTGMDTSGTDGSGAIVQSATNKDETGSATSLTVTLGAFGSVNNATYGAFGTDGNPLPTAGSGFTTLATAVSTTDVRTTSEWQSGNDTSVDMSFASAVLVGGVAIEIKEAVAGGLVSLISRALLGVGT